MQRYFLELFFKGTHYSGWQIQKNAVAVQQKINEALGMLINGSAMKPIETTGCGRTDTGVHAIQFFAHFDALIIEDHKNFLYQLNGILPNDITILNLHVVDNDCHARYDAVSRTYQYYIHTYKNGFLEEFSGCYYRKFDVSLMQKAADILLKHDDFNSFCKARAQSKTSLCKVTHAKWSENYGGLMFEITADRFLRGMVRALIGTMTDVGIGKINLNDFENIIAARNRRKAGHAAPACGLYLTKIVYPFLNIKSNNLLPHQL
ncbi:MAG TPA: tRNA pseudouridine(38-40) synthase TruA [Bacteroidia bacterium]|jgi:tRNA pseudouridine38-40 synthase|nr:tRNA pseudouridine(38-40) synthase TruA [Bacteroidia bacterium]HMU18843.1 tRNA pseudouridine(38-40) synthase TruA [Bacteroidia bacterium]